MKKFLLSAFALLLAMTAGAQKFQSFKYTGKLDTKVETRSAAKKAPAKVSLPSNQRYVGQTRTDDCANYLGATGLVGDNPVGILVEQSDYAMYMGAKVVGMRYNVSNTTISNVFVYGLTDKDIDEVLSKEDGVTSNDGWNTVMFDEDEQFTLNNDYLGFLFGYTYNQTKANYSLGMNDKVAGEFYLYANIPESQGGSGEGWYNMGSQYGALCVQLIVEDDNFKDNSVTPYDFGKFDVALGHEKNVAIALANAGNKFESIDYTITLEGKTSAEQHVDFGKDLGMGGTYYLNVPFAAASKVGEYPTTFTITKVNGVKNDAKVTAASGTNNTLSKALKKNSVVEEFTGTGCGWCPRGHAGMHKLRETFGEQFIGIALHQYSSSDPMYNGDYNLNFSGAPSCVINREGSTLDPYYGSQNNIVDDFRASLNAYPVAAVSVTGEYNDDKTQVTATAKVESIVDGNYEVAYMLVADGLKGTSSSWKQTNYYSSAMASQTGLTEEKVPEDMLDYWNGTSKIAMTYNDVLIASSYKDSENQAKFDALTANGTTTGSYTLTLPTKKTLKNAINGEGAKVYVVAMIIDPTTGAIVNAEKTLVGAESGIAGVKTNTNATVVARYAADGTRLQAPQKGINIIKMSDGTTRKVLVNE